MPSINGWRFRASLKIGTTMEISGGKGGLTMASPSACSDLGIQKGKKIEYDITKKHCHKIPMAVILYQYVPLEYP
jgi:hypothetical protein